MKSFSTVLDMVVSETYSSNKQTSKRHQSKNLIDTGIPCSFFIFFGWGLDRGCWATNQGYHLPLKSKSLRIHQLGCGRLDLLKSQCRNILDRFVSRVLPAF
jgi:hypothetical protein